MPTASMPHTLVFTDVDRSADLWARDREAMSEAIRLHDATLRALLQEHGGEELHGVGDALLTRWSDPLAAVRWCAAVQLALLDVDWPSGLLVLPGVGEVVSPRGERLFRGLRVRMGAHLDRAGGAQPSQEAVRRAARIAGAARGGQVLLSGPLWETVEAGASRDLVTTDLGYRRLRGLSGEERLVQVLPERIAARRFPPPDTVDLRRSNLPPEVTLFVGRREDLSALSEIYGFGARLVTIYGAGGIGKTRLALRLASSQVADYAHQGGVWLAQVHEARTPDEVTRAVATALDVPLTVGRTGHDATAQIGFALASRGPLLLVLDGLDHPAAGAELGKWLAAAPQARLLVTGLKRLGVPGEIAYALSGLDDETERSAVDLMVARAPRERPDLRTTGSDSVAAAAAAHLVRGVPLALELVGSQPGAQTWGDLARDLERWFQAVGAPDTSDAALAGALGWIWEHLALWERELLAQMAVCRGGFDVPAAEKIVDLTAFPAAPWVPDVLAGLCARCLLEDVTLADAPGSPRYRMHRSIREHVKMRLPRGRRSAAEDRHAAYYLARAEAWAEEARGPDALEALAALERERDNLLAVHRRGLMRGGPRGITWALRAVLALDPLLVWRGPPDVHLDLLNQALSASDSSSQPLPTELVTHALRARASVRRVLGRMHEGTADLERARDLANVAGLTLEEARNLTELGEHLRLFGRLDDARRVASQALGLARELGDPSAIAAALLLGGSVALADRDLPRARAFLEESVEFAVIAGDRRIEGRAVGNLGVAARWEGRTDETEVLYRRAIDIHRQTGDRRLEGLHLGNLGVLLLHRGEVDEARRTFEEALSQSTAVGFRRGEAAARTNLGLAAVIQGRLGDAGPWLADGLALHEATDGLQGQAFTHWLLGVVAHLRHSDEAAEHYAAACRLADASGDPRVQALARLWRAVWSIEQGDAEIGNALWADGQAALSECVDASVARAADILAMVRRERQGEPANELRALMEKLPVDGVDARVALQYAREALDR